VNVFLKHGVVKFGVTEDRVLLKHKGYFSLHSYLISSSVETWQMLWDSTCSSHIL